jgi:hypothetical protein
MSRRRYKVILFSFLKILFSIRDLINRPAKNLYGARNLPDLIMSRGGIYNNWHNLDESKQMSNSYICQRHVDELGNQWSRETFQHIKHRKIGGETKPMCSIPECLDGYADMPPVVKKQRTLTRDESEAIYKMRNTLVHAGIRKLKLKIYDMFLALCERHKSFAEQLLKSLNFLRKNRFLYRFFKFS